jgi:chemosensory pili system protein ChpC
MIPVTAGNVLLPNTSVADILSYMKPDPVPNMPVWLLGRLQWRGWRVPLISFPALTGRLDEESRVRARIIVLKALGGNAAMPFLALLSQGFPHLTTITPDTLVPLDDWRPDVVGVRAEVQIRDGRAAIPDLDAIEGLITKALAG